MNDPTDYFKGYRLYMSSAGSIKWFGYGGGQHSGNLGGSYTLNRKNYVYAAKCGSQMRLSTNGPSGLVGPSSASAVDIKYTDQAVLRIGHQPSVARFGQVDMSNFIGKIYRFRLTQGCRPMPDTSRGSEAPSPANSSYHPFESPS